MTMMTVCSLSALLFDCDSAFFADIYGVSTATASKDAMNGQTNGQVIAKKMRTVIHLSLRDSIPAYGPIASMAFSLAKNGVGPTAKQYHIKLTII